MNVTILELKTKLNTKAKISLIKKNKNSLPSITDGWRFNFNKHSKEKDCETYVLTTQKTPEIIEGCLIINTKRTIIRALQ